MFFEEPERFRSESFYFASMTESTRNELKEIFDELRQQFDSVNLKLSETNEQIRIELECLETIKTQKILKANEFKKRLEYLIAEETEKRIERRIERENEKKLEYLQNELEKEMKIKSKINEFQNFLYGFSHECFYPSSSSEIVFQKD